MVVESTNQLDEVNRALLIQLEADPRLPVAELARRVGLSATATSERLRRLKESGVFVGTSVMLDPAAMGYPLLAFVRMRPFKGAAPALLRRLAEMPEVVECHHTTGEDCYLIRVHARDMQHLEELTTVMSSFGETTTSLCYSTPIATRSLLHQVAVER